MKANVAPLLLPLLILGALVLFFSDALKNATPYPGKEKEPAPPERATTTPRSSSTFRGPTATPHIIGPSGPPPNY